MKTKIITTRIFKFSALLLVSSILINFTPVSGNTDLTDKNTDFLNQIDLFDVKSKLTEFTSQFIEHEDRFVSQTADGSLSVSKSGVMRYSFKSPDLTLVTENLVNANDIIVKGNKATETEINYLVGENQTTNLKAYKELNLSNIYQGIDLALKNQNGRIEKQFTLNPGTDPSKIQIGVKGADDLSLNEKNEIVINEHIKATKPIAFQILNGQKEQIKAEYKIINKNTYGYSIGTYDPTQPLIIDPILYSTYLGGDEVEEYTSEVNTSDNILVIAADPGDSNEYIYVTGYTSNGGDFPSENYLPPADPAERGSTEIFVVKMPLDLSEITAAAMIGGNNNDTYSSITADSNGDIYVYFRTNSTDIPVTDLSYQTVFGGNSDTAIIKLNPALDTILAGTYLGGSNSDFPANIVASNNKVYLSGTTNSAGGNDFPVGPTSGADEVYSHASGTLNTELFLARMDEDLSNSEYIGTYIHPDSGGGFIDVLSTDTNPDNDIIFITGRTNTGLETPLNVYQTTYGGGTNDNFVARFDSKLTTMQTATYIGGSGSSNGEGSIKVYDSGGGVYKVITANDTIDGTQFFPSLRTDGSNNRYDYDEYPNNGIINNCNDDDVYLANFNYDLTEANVALICGDAFDFHPRAVIDASNNIYLSANSNSSNFPVTDDSYLAHEAGFYDIALIKLSPDLSAKLASTYLGGSEAGDIYGVGMDFDASGNFYISGQTFSPDFPTTPGVYKPVNETYYSDYFITGFTNDLTSPCAPMLNNEDTDGAGDISSVSETCLGIKINPGSIYFENYPSSFSFPAKYSTTVAQSSFNNTVIEADDVLTIRDLRGTGSFDVTIQASSLTNGIDTIDLNNLYVVSSAPTSGALDNIDTDLNGTTSAEEIVYADGSLGQNLTSTIKTSGDITFPSTYETDGENFGSGVITLFSATEDTHYLRASQALNFYLNIPPNQEPGTYTSIFTIDLIPG